MHSECILINIIVMNVISLVLLLLLLLLVHGHYYYHSVVGLFLDNPWIVGYVYFFAIFCYKWGGIYTHICTYIYIYMYTQYIYTYTHTNQLRKSRVSKTVHVLVDSDAFRMLLSREWCERISRLLECTSTYTASICPRAEYKWQCVKTLYPW